MATRIEQLRITMAGAAEWLAMRPWGHCPGCCLPCQRIGQKIENTALSLDLAVAQQVAGRAAD